MRTYYFFKINNTIYPIYQKKNVNIYKMLNEINSLNIKEYSFASKLYKRIVSTIEKDKINNHILMNHINDIYYTKNKNIHEIICDIETSKIIVNNTFIKLVTTSNISSFFKDLYNYDREMFVVDFNNKDYFFLEELEFKVLAS